jgi:hypothetical protein
VKEFVLGEGERLVGVTSKQTGESYAQHYGLKFLIGKME